MDTKNKKIQPNLNNQLNISEKWLDELLKHDALRKYFEDWKLLISFYAASTNSKRQTIIFA